MTLDACKKKKNNNNNNDILTVHLKRSPEKQTWRECSRSKLYGMGWKFKVLPEISKVG